MSYEIILKSILEKYLSVLKSNLVGIYVHGSIALGCFNWNKSDIDYIVVVNEPLSQKVKMRLMDITLQLDAIAPLKGLEMSVVLKETCLNFIYPTSFELHYSNMHKEWYLKDPVEYCEKMNGLDEDLAAHFTIINQYGVVLYGPLIEEVFGKVPKEDYVKSIKADVKNAKIHILKNPVYIILNLCRVAAYLRDEVILSKEQGGHWGIANLKDCYEGIITKALNSYRTDEIMTIEKEEADNFCAYMLNEIDDY